MSVLDDWSTQQRTAAASILGLILLMGGWFFWPRTPTQMGADEEVFASVDALFTAVTAHDERLLRQAEQRLKAFQDAERLPAGAAGYLEGVIQDARGGDWKSAAEELYWFMKGQRREGERDARIAKRKP